MLSDVLKKDIQSAYSALLEQKGYKARLCQKQMVADIASTLGNIEQDEAGGRISEHNICVVEAGTGTGKTIAYAIAALPIAKALKKTLVISTATIALQEQIVFIDLPDIKKHAGLDFSFVLAKGRRRYLCLARLDTLLQTSQNSNYSLAFYEDETYTFDETHALLYENMLQKLGRGDWNGDRDDWGKEIEPDVWQRVSTDHVQCTGKKCSHYENCCFYKAREQIHRVDCIVTNHDLVLSDMIMGGGAILPSPENIIFVFDEGHHLPDKAISHFSNFIQIHATQTWLEHLPGQLKKLTDALGQIGGLPHNLVQIENNLQDLSEQLAFYVQMVAPLKDASETDRNAELYRFAGGKVSLTIKEMSTALYQAKQRLLSQLNQIQNGIEEEMLNGDIDKSRLEYWLPVVSGMIARMEAGASLWQDYMIDDPTDQPPKARWLKFMENDELMVQASPIAVHNSLKELLWNRCFGAVVTSATLAIGDDFSRLRSRSGISENNSFRVLPSPFRFAEQAVLQVPAMGVDPRQAEAHNLAVVALLPRLLPAAVQAGSLILFASWRQMYRIADALAAEFMTDVLRQGDLSKAEIIAQHRRRVDAGKRSIIFGLASFAEGIDLPGDYCQHVVIVKIPFAVPNDPVGATLSEWIEASGGNAFQEIMIPDAVLRLVQACGRLLRTETDTGTVSILDRRLITQSYGRRILNALPPFRRNIQ